MIMPWYGQEGFDLRFEWGLEGAKRLSSGVDISIIVDVLSFSTCVDIAVGRSARVYPFLFKDGRAIKYAKEIGGVCAKTERSKTHLCLSPRTLLGLEPGTNLVLPSPNGSTIAFSIKSGKILCGCLRNSTAVAAKASTLGQRILLIAAGERWPDGSLRPALEDIIGAGAILARLPGTRSPEAQWAIRTFEDAKTNLLSIIRDCASGRELIERGFPEDVEDAAEFDVSANVSILRDKCFVAEAHQ